MKGLGEAGHLIEYHLKVPDLYTGGIVIINGLDEL